MLHLPWPRKLRLLFAIVVPWKWTPFVINETIYEFIDYIYCFSNRHKLLRCGSRAMFVRPFWARGLLWSGIRREASREDVCTCQCYCSGGFIISNEGLREGFKKKNQLWKIPYRGLTLPPPGYGKIFVIFVKSVFLPLKIQKNLENFSKKDKTTFRQANFCLLRCQILLRRAQ